VLEQRLDLLRPRGQSDGKQWAPGSGANASSGAPVSRWMDASSDGSTANRCVFFATQPTRGDRLWYGGNLAWLLGPASVKFEYDIQMHDRRGLGPRGRNLDKVTATDSLSGSFGAIIQSFTLFLHYCREATLMLASEAGGRETTGKEGLMASSACLY
jgi:hypothetical protein